MILQFLQKSSSLLMSCVNSNHMCGFTKLWWDFQHNVIWFICNLCKFMQVFFPLQQCMSLTIMRVSSWGFCQQMELCYSVSNPNIPCGRLDETSLHGECKFHLDLFIGLFSMKFLHPLQNIWPKYYTDGISQGSQESRCCTRLYVYARGYINHLMKMSSLCVL